MTLAMDDRAFFEQAQTAAEQQNWSHLSHLLLQRIGGQETPSRDRETARSDALAGQAESADRLLALALQVLEFGDFQARWDAAKAVVSFGEVAIAPLMGYLQAEDIEPEVQWFAVRILAEHPQPEVISALIQVLKTATDEDLCAATVTALAQMGKPAIVVLADLLSTPETRLFATQALSQIRQSETIPPLLQVVQDPDPQVRAIAIEALGSFHRPEITRVLIAALSDTIAAVRKAAVTGLGFRQAADFEAGSTECENLVTQLHLRLRDIRTDIGQQSAIALGRIGTPAAIAALLEGLQSPLTPEALAYDMIRALGWSDRAEGLEALARALHLPELSEHLHLEILTTIGRFQSEALKPRATEILLDLLKTNDSAHYLDHPVLVQQTIALALGQLGQPTAIPDLIALLATPDLATRLHIVSALKSLDPQMADTQLQQHLQTADPKSELAQGMTIALAELRRSQPWQEQI